MRTTFAVAAAATLGLATIANAQAWTGFQFGGAGDVVVIPIDVTDDFPKLQVTDSFLSGDWFSVRVLDGSSVVAEFECSEPTSQGDSISDYDLAFADPRWSSGEQCLTARGPLTLEITVIASPFGAGGAGWRLTDGECASPCPADLDGDGVYTIFDFLAFQNLFDAGDLIADFDGDGALTLFDFLAFQNEFDLGCE
jgi:hypothetical protein